MDPSLDALLSSTLDDFDAEPSLPPLVPPRAEPVAKKPEHDDITKKMLASLARIEARTIQPDPVLTPEFSTMRSLILESQAIRRGDAPTSRGAGPAEAAVARPSAKAQGSPKKNVNASLDETMEQLLQNTEDMAGQGSEEEAMKLLEEMMKGMGGAGGLDGGGDVSEEQAAGLISQMMENLMTKDVLYPSLQEVSKEYPIWLAENKSKISADQYANYTSQFELMKKMCAAYEDDAKSSSEQVKYVMGAMEEIQKFGSPPEEIMKKMGVQMGPDGMPQLPGFGMPGGEGCSVM